MALSTFVDSFAQPTSRNVFFRAIGKFILLFLFFLILVLIFRYCYKEY